MNSQLEQKKNNFITLQGYKEDFHEQVFLSFLTERKDNLDFLISIEWFR